MSLNIPEHPYDLPLTWAPMLGDTWDYTRGHNDLAYFRLITAEPDITDLTNWMTAAHATASDLRLDTDRNGATARITPRGGKTHTSRHQPENPGTTPAENLLQVLYALMLDTPLPAPIPVRREELVALGVARAANGGGDGDLRAALGDHGDRARASTTGSDLTLTAGGEKLRLPRLLLSGRPGVGAVWMRYALAAQ